MKILHYVDENMLSWSKPWLQLLEEIGKKDDVEQAILCRPGGTLKRQAEEAGFKVFAYKPAAAWCRPLCRGFKEILEDFRPDVVHTRLSTASAIAGYWATKARIPVVSTVDKYPKGKYYVNSSLLVAPSRAVARHMKDQGFGGEKIVIIANPIRVADYAPKEEERTRFRSAEGIDENTLVLLAMGRFVAWKGFDLLIEATASLKTDKPFCLWIVGDGPMREDLLQKTKRHFAETDPGKVRFFPFAEDVRPYLWAADLFVQPSFYVPGSGGPEGFSLALVEALAAGLPAVAFDCGGAPDIIKEGVNGWLAEPGNVNSLRGALQRALNHLPDGKMRAQAMQKAAKLDVSHVAASYLEVYQSFIL
ncbi:glycosyltransferase family 4 protein [Acetomicrobium sp.]|mgnify:FL=1|jgi:glycosyltransferase involved in cell wall biosynthesis|uniref:glycosyltransferase family 4 protein n=1 Tax=Acetomicrobium sp. TaxID=1872099 RepID=UPI002B262FEC|nr:glycosyltransferase family 4 protein [Acetomicrobium sp.]